MDIKQNVLDLVTGEMTQSIVQESAADKKARELHQATITARNLAQVEADTAKAAASAKLAALGLTTDDLKALGL